MPRKKRIISPGHCYHVMMRGIGGRKIFEDNKDRARFCLLLQYASETCKFNVHGFCLMGNHVHLLLEPYTGDLSSGMHRLSFRYAQYYNKKVNRQGYLFQSRYRSIIIQHGIYLRRLIRYIHRNPLRANLVQNLSHYPWSSHQAYEENAEFVWLKKSLILSLFENELQGTLTSFNQYVHSDDSEAKKEIDEIRNSFGVGAYGSDIFVEEFRDEQKSDQVSLVLNEVKNKIKIDDFLFEFKKVIGFTLNELQSTSREKVLVDARSIFTSAFLKLSLGSTRDLANLFRRETTSINRLKERLQQSSDLQKLANQIISNLILESCSAS